MDREQGRGNVEEILRKDQYTVEELADILDMDEHVIRRAARDQELNATFIGHSISSIRREDVLRWLEQRA